MSLRGHCRRGAASKQPAETAALQEHFAANQRQEIDLIRMADVTIVVSPFERDELRRVAPASDVRIISTVHHPSPSPRPCGARSGLLFVGYFVLRFLAEDVGKELDAVLDAILRAIGHRAPWAVSPLHVFPGSRP